MSMRRRSPARQRSLQHRRAGSSEELGDRRQRRESVAQAGEVARAGASKRDAGGDALDIYGALQRTGKLTASRRRGDQLGDRAVAGTCNFRIPSRIRQPLPQLPAAGVGDACVEER